MLILKESTKVELIIKNSKFITEIDYVENPESAREIISQRRQIYSSASHVVYAFITGNQGNIMGSSDAGEPSGTAGRPTLEVLKGSNITNILLTTARWFGGTKLGTSGLVHAYSDSAKFALENAITTELVAMTEFEFSAPYPLYEQIKRVLAEYQTEIHNEDFADKITIKASIFQDNFPKLQKTISELSNGKIRVSPTV